MSDDLEFEPVPPAPPPEASPMARIFKAMSKARGEYPDIPKNRVATVKSDKAQYSYKYADLSDVFNAIDPVLSSHGLTVVQFPAGGELVTVIGHESGETVEGRWPIRPMARQTLDNAQGFQSAVQAAKRYALTAMLGISTEETVEGDARRKDFQINDDFETGDGVRMPRGAKVTKSMTQAEKAAEAARAIMEQFKEAKTAVGVSGAWDRNAVFIEHLAKKYDAHYQNVLDAFSAAMDAFSEDAAE